MTSDSSSELLVNAPPPVSPVEIGAPEQWTVIENLLDTALPADYKWLIHTYGSGDFCDLLIILNPFSQSEGMNLQAQINPILEIYQEYREVFTKECCFPVYPESGGILPLAQDTNGNDLFWVTQGPPDKWPLVHYNWRGGCQRQEYDMPLVEFLSSWISGRMSGTFFGVRNLTDIIRRDPVFCPLGQTRPPRSNAPNSQ